MTELDNNSIDREYADEHSDNSDNTERKANGGSDQDLNQEAEQLPKGEDQSESYGDMNQGTNSEGMPTYLHRNNGAGNKKTNRGVWYLAVPLFISFGTSFVASLIGFIYVLYIKNPELVTKLQEAGTQANQSTELINELMNSMMKYSTEFTILSACIAVPIFLFMYLRDAKIMKSQGMALSKKEKLWKYIPVFLFAIAGCVVMNNLVTLSNLAEVSDAYQTVSEAQYAMQLQVQLVGFGLIIPVMEELLYRGLIYRRLRTFLYPRTAILWSSLVFALIHGNVVQGIYAFALGMALAYFYEHYHSIKAPIFAHMVMNLTSVILTQYQIFQWQFAKPLRVGIVTVGCAFVAACMFVLIMNTTQEECDGPRIPRR